MLLISKNKQAKKKTRKAKKAKEPKELSPGNPLKKLWPPR